MTVGDLLKVCSKEEVGTGNQFGLVITVDTENTLSRKGEVK